MPPRSSEWHLSPPSDTYNYQVRCLRLRGLKQLYFTRIEEVAESNDLVSFVDAKAKVVNGVFAP